MDIIKRIVNIIFYLSTHPEGVSGGKLAKVCGVSWSVLKEDLDIISRGYPVYTDHDESDSKDDESKPEVKWFLMPSSEQYLPITLGVQDMMVLHRALEFVGESLERTRLKQKIVAAFGFEEEKTYRFVKGNMDPIQPIDVNIFPHLNLAINECKQLTFSLRGRKAVVEPLGIVYYSRIRHWYLLAREGETVKTFNMQNLTNLRLTNNSFTPPEGFDIGEWIAPRWGMEYGEPMQVKVRFRSDTYDKVRKDTAHRKSKLTQIDGGQSFIMEDTIVGENEFIAWILGFGSTAEILEPVHLRKKVRDKVKEALAVYL